KSGHNGPLFHATATTNHRTGPTAAVLHDDLIMNPANAVNTEIADTILQILVHAEMTQQPAPATRRSGYYSVAWRTRTSVPSNEDVVLQLLPSKH
ncbi:unnamed protein product, partial [Effrenium voratum]